MHVWLLLLVLMLLLLSVRPTQAGSTLAINTLAQTIFKHTHTHTQSKHTHTYTHTLAP